LDKISIVYLAARSHTPMVDALINAGIQVWEALSISEAEHLCEYQKIDAIVIAENVHNLDVKELQSRHITVQLRAGAQVREVLWELTHLFSGNQRVQ
jgi:hypothetical protein